MARDVERRKEYLRNYRVKHKVRDAARHKEWVARNRDRYNATNMRYKIRNAERIKRKRLSQQDLAVYLRQNFTYKDGALLENITGRVIGCMTPRGYITCTVHHTRMDLHRLIWIYFNGPYDCKTKELDHIDRNVSNNKIENLRCVSKTVNRLNADVNKTNTSGYRGVYFDKQRRKWCARCMVHGKQVYLGFYTDVKDAGEAVLNYIKQTIQKEVSIGVMG